MVHLGMGGAFFPLYGIEKDVREKKYNCFEILDDLCLHIDLIYLIGGPRAKARLAFGHPPIGRLSSFALTHLTGSAHAPPIKCVRADCDSRHEKKIKNHFLPMPAILAAQQPAVGKKKVPNRKKLRVCAERLLLSLKYRIVILYSNRCASLINKGIYGATLINCPFAG